MNSTANAATLVRGFPYVTAAARDAHRALPATSDVGRHVERAALLGDGLHEANQRHGWPGPGAMDQGFREVVLLLREASTTSERPRTIDELSEAERLVGSCIWSAAHTVAEVSRDHLVELQATFARVPATPEMMLEQDLTRDSMGRVLATENLMINSLAGSGDVGRSEATSLSAAVAEWDIHAHRALLSNRSTSCLAIIARNESSVQRMFAAAMNQAASTGVVDPHTAARLAPTLSTLGDSWEDLTQRVRDLSWGAEPVPRAVITAADRLKGAFHSTDFQSSSEASREKILSALNSHLSSSFALAVAASELVRSGELEAPARAINRAILSAEESFDHSPVSPAELLRGGSIPLPPEARRLLASPIEQIYRDSEEALNRGSGLDSIIRHVGPRAPEVKARAMRDPRPSAPGLGLGPQPLAPPV